MTRAVVDASVAAKWVVPEEFSEQASLLKGRALCAPAHWQAEAVNVVWSKVCRRELSAAEAVPRARALMRAPVELVPLSGLMDEALKHSLAHEIAVHDSLYLALAIARDIMFVTADRKLLRKLRAASAFAAHTCWVGDLRP